MQNPKFRNADGQLSHYALMCGYVQTEATGPVVAPAGGAAPRPRYTVRLSHTGGDTYDVKVSDAALSLGLAAWEQFDALPEARRAFRRAVAHYGGLPADALPAERDVSASALTPDWAAA